MVWRGRDRGVRRERQRSNRRLMMGASDGAHGHRLLAAVVEVLNLQLSRRGSAIAPSPHPRSAHLGRGSLRPRSASLGKDAAACIYLNLMIYMGIQ